ncbi:MAG: cell division protein FtsA [Candidatus Hydrogenedentota bacterium]|nr:MAG: cell division protein FtsA [Candidatus Hydrogenedentota bacterium]
MSYDEENILSVIDLGSSKITCLIARVLSPDEIELVGLGVSPSRGIKAGSVTNIEQTAQSIKEAVEEAEIMSAYTVDNAIINISGKHVKGDNSSGVIAITNRERVVTPQDIYRVIEAAQAVRIPADQEIMHVLSREFKVDDQTGIKDPTGMVGVRLESEVHIVTGSITHIQNTEKAVRTAGIEVADKVLSALASAEALLTEGEKDLGVALVDMGAGVIDLIVYSEGGVAYSSTICLGGNHITQDISIGLKTPMNSAEVLKKNFGCAMASLVDPMEMLEVPSVGERPPRTVPRKELAEIIEARLRELFELIDHELIKSGYKNTLAGGIIFTGGASLTDEFLTLAEEVIGLGASVGSPKGILGISDKISSPVFSTAAGLLYYGARYKGGMQKTKEKGLLGRMKSWIKENL